MKYSEVGGYGSVPQKKHRGLVIVIVLFLVVLLVVGGIFYYKLKYSKNSIQLLFDTVYNYLDSYIENNDYDSLTGTFSMQMKFQSTDETETEIFNIFNKLDFSGNYGVDYNKNIMSLDFSSNYDDKDLIDMSIYTEYGRAYIYLNGLYDKYIDTSVDDYSALFERNLDDYKTVINRIRRTMNESLKDDYFTVEKVTVDSEKLTKTTLDLTGNNYQEWNKNFTKMLLKDEVYLESYAKILDKDIEYVKKELNDALEDEKDYEGEKIVLYTKKNRIVKFEMSNSEERIVVKNSDNKYDYELYENGVEIASGTTKVNMNDNGSKILFSYYDNEEQLGMEITIDISVKTNGEVEKKDVTNSISSEKISEDDIISIYNKLMENEGVVKIIEEVSKLIGYDDSNSSLPMITG